MQTPRTIRCAIYTRQSRGTRTEFTSCEAQFLACHDFVRSHLAEGWIWNDHWYDDEDESSDTLIRPGMQRLLQDIRAGDVDRLVVYRLDRLSRTVLDFLSLVHLLRERGIPLSIITAPELGESAHDTFVLNILASMAEFEREIIRSRMTEARAALKLRGRRVAGVVPYGYRTDRVTKQLVPMPTEAKRVRKMYQFAAEGKTPREIAAIAGRRRWRTARGKRWTPRQILATLANPVYAGRIRDGKQNRTGVHQAIVDEALFARAAAAVASRRTGKQARRRSRIRWFLRGRLYCGRCGRLMVPTTTHYRMFRYRYYRCRSFTGGRPPCAGMSIPAETIEKYVRHRLIDPAAWSSMDSLTPDQKSRALRSVWRSGLRWTCWNKRKRWLRSFGRWFSTWTEATSASPSTRPPSTRRSQQRAGGPAFPLIRLDHDRESPGAEEQTERMSRQCIEVPLPVERLGSIVETIQDNGHEGKRLSRLAAVAERLRDQSCPQSLSLMLSAHAQPSQHRHREASSREVLGHLDRQIAEIHLCHRQRIVADDLSVPGIDDHPRGGEMLFLMLQRFGRQPVVDGLFTTSETPTRVVPPQTLQP